MANSAQARKRARQAEKRRMRHKAQRSAMRSRIKAVVNAIAAGDKDAAGEAYKAAVPIIDSMAGKGVIHKNKAARHKSRLHGRVQAMNA